jgi:hypothetical protein
MRSNKSERWTDNTMANEESKSERWIDNTMANEEQ